MLTTTSCKVSLWTQIASTSSHLRTLAGEDILDSLECYLGWLHSKAGHDMGCQLKFSVLYAEGFGRAIGEKAEQLRVSLA